jgi:hypothetical protein
VSPTGRTSLLDPNGLDGCDGRFNRPTPALSRYPGPSVSHRRPRRPSKTPPTGGSRPEGHPSAEPSYICKLSPALSNSMTKSRDSPKAPKLLEASQAPPSCAYAMQPKKPWEVALRDSQTLLSSFALCAVSVSSPRKPPPPLILSVLFGSPLRDSVGSRAYSCRQPSAYGRSDRQGGKRAAQNANNHPDRCPHTAPVFRNSVRSPESANSVKRPSCSFRQCARSAPLSSGRPRTGQLRPCPRAAHRSPNAQLRGWP